MCTQIDYVYQKCGHRRFARFRTCPNFGMSCLGAGGDHESEPVDDTCEDCKVRAKDPNPPYSRETDPYLKKKKKQQK